MFSASLDGSKVKPCGAHPTMQCKERLIGNISMIPMEEICHSHLSQPEQMFEVFVFQCISHHPKSQCHASQESQCVKPNHSLSLSFELYLNLLASWKHIFEHILCCSATFWFLSTLGKRFSNTSTLCKNEPITCGPFLCVISLSSTQEPCFSANTLGNWRSWMDFRHLLAPPVFRQLAHNRPIPCARVCGLAHWSPEMTETWCQKVFSSRVGSTPVKTAKPPRKQFNSIPITQLHRSWSQLLKLLVHRKCTYSTERFLESRQCNSIAQNFTCTQWLWNGVLCSNNLSWKGMAVWCWVIICLCLAEGVLKETFDICYSYTSHYITIYHNYNLNHQTCSGSALT